MTADERFYPKKLNISYSSHKRHFERYFKILQFCKNLGKEEIWLDSACGSGFGTNLLSNFASNVYGYDISEEAVFYAEENYSSKNCFFTSKKEILQEKKFDKIFSVETIEHMPKAEAKNFLSFLLELLKKDGNLLITTPIVTQTNLNPKNKFHCIEYSDLDFSNLLQDSGYRIIRKRFIKTIFTDGERKLQGYYLCKVK